MSGAEEIARLEKLLDQVIDFEEEAELKLLEIVNQYNKSLSL